MVWCSIGAMYSRSFIIMDVYLYLQIQGKTSDYNGICGCIYKYENKCLILMDMCMYLQIQEQVSDCCMCACLCNYITI